MITRLLALKVAPKIVIGLVVALGLALAAAAFAGNRWLAANAENERHKDTIKQRDAALEDQVAASEQLAHLLAEQARKHWAREQQARELLEFRQRAAFEAREANETTIRELRVAVSASECAPVRVPDSGIAGLQQFAASARGIPDGGSGPFRPDPVPVD